MRRLVVVTAATVLAGVLLASWGATASAREAGPNGAQAAAQKKKKKPLPPLPANIKSRGRWNIAVKCDTPPFGYIGARSQNAGFDVEIARWFARFAFGKANRVNMSCVTTPARESFLTTERVDLVIATFTYNTDRETRIDFSRAYYKATGRLLVRNNSPIRTLADLPGKTIATTSGSVYDRWVKNCHKNTNLIVTDSFTNAQLAFRDGRADALMFDDTILLGIAVTDPALKLTEDLFLAQPYGIGIKQGNVALKRWVDSRLEVMRKRDVFFPILKNTVPPRQVAPFSKNILRPKQTFGYNQGDITQVCG
jgi:polar amino acid transport system substrate-binding protein